MVVVCLRARAETTSPTRGYWHAPDSEVYPWGQSKLIPSAHFGDLGLQHASADLGRYSALLKTICWPHIDTSFTALACIPLDDDSDGCRAMLGAWSLWLRSHGVQMNCHTQQIFIIATSSFHQNTISVVSTLKQAMLPLLFDIKPLWLELHLHLYHKPLRKRILFSYTSVPHHTPWKS